AGTEGARDHFFSPDSQWIGFFADGKLKKNSVNGGAAVQLGNAPDDRGGTWADDGTIIFAPSSSSGLLRVSSSGGKEEALTKLDQSGQGTHRWPHALPGRRGVLFISGPLSATFEDADIVVQSLQSGDQKVVQHGGYYPGYLPTGHLVYMHQGTLFAAAFDLDRLEVTSQPVPAVEGVLASSPSYGGAQFSFSQNGSLVYLPGSIASPLVSIQWMDRAGKTQPLRQALGNFFDLRFSPDGKRLAIFNIDQQQDVWIYEWARDAMLRLTTDPLIDRYPVWTPDGRRITYGSVRGNKSSFNVYWQ